MFKSNIRRKPKHDGSLAHDFGGSLLVTQIPHTGH